MIEDILEQYKAIGSQNISDAEAIFELTSEYLGEIKTQGYKHEFATFVEGLIDKIVVIAENLELDENLIEHISNTEAEFISVINNPNTTVVARTSSFNKLFSAVMKFHNQASRLKSKDSGQIGPFQPNNSDKLGISQRISQAIDMIERSEFLTAKVKGDLIDKLSKVIAELHNPKTNWSVYYQNISNAIVLIGALTSIAVDSIAISELFETKQKLEQANETLQRTSLTYSVKDIKEVFIINETPLISPTITYRLEEKATEKKDENTK